MVYKHRMNNNHFKDYRFTGLPWTMDYPCEAKVREKGKYSPLTAQDMTIKNQIKLLDQGQDMTIKNQIKLLDQGVETQMVVQGYDNKGLVLKFIVIKQYLIIRL